MERNVRERMSVQDNEVLTPQQIINIRPVTARSEEFFKFFTVVIGSSWTNTTHCQSCRPQTSFVALDRWFDTPEFVTHYTHYGRMCPIETPEGPNIGLITTCHTGHLLTMGMVSPFKHHIVRLTVQLVK